MIRRVYLLTEVGGLVAVLWCRGLGEERRAWRERVIYPSYGVFKT